MTVQWRVWNNGSRHAIGYKCDTAYLSEDDSWDITDYQIGKSLCTSISLNPAGPTSNPPMQPEGSVIHSAVRSTPFIAQNNYSFILRTRTNIRDPDLSNNIGTSVTSVRVNAPTLLLGIPTNLSMRPGSDLVYKIYDVPSEKTLIATLTTESSGLHVLFLRHRNPPTGSNYDAFSQYSLSHNQTAVVQSTKPGSYYIRIKSFGQENEPYQVCVEVKVATFEITNVHPSSTAPLGNVTLHITGTLISNEVEAALISDKTSTTIIAGTVYWFSSVDVYATFDVWNISTGAYVIQLTNTETNQLAQLQNKFHIISSGIPGQISTRIDAPQNLLRGETTIINVHVQNTGNTDIDTPIMFVHTGGRNVQLSLVDSSIENNIYTQELLFLPMPLQGPFGIIPPGVTTKTLLSVLPNSFRSTFNDILSVSFLDESQLDYAHSYVERKQELKPQDIPDDSWNVIWKNFLSSIGHTWRTMTKRFSEVANEQSVVKKRVQSVDEMLDFQLQIAQGSVGPLGKCKSLVYFHPHVNFIL